MMDQWHFDAAAHFDQSLADRLKAVTGRPDVLTRSLRSVAALAVRCWLRLYHRLTIVGFENLPAERSFVMIANHASHLDTLCLLSALPIGRLNRTFPAAATDYFCVNTTRALLAAVVVNALPFERHIAPWQSLAACSRLLEEPGTVLILFPEGTRCAGPEPGEFKPGVALLAAGRDLPVVPCHIAGTHAALPKGSRFPRPRSVRLTIGAPHIYAHLPATKDSARRISSELRDAVIELGQSRD
jgi:1-acyl-sn-glycerol-3-phosphate acyltransferase